MRSLAPWMEQFQQVRPEALGSTLPPAFHLSLSHSSLLGILPWLLVSDCPRWGQTSGSNLNTEPDIPEFVRPVTCEWRGQCW